MKVIFVRHAETEWNQHGVILGYKDSPLSARGTLQHLLLTEFLVLVLQRARGVTRVDHRTATVLAQLSLRELILCTFWLPRGGRIDNT